MAKKITMNVKQNIKTFGEGYKEFTLNCKVRNLSKFTIEHYDNVVVIWYKYMPNEIAIKDITKETIDKFIIFMREKTSQNDITINTNLRGIRAICYFFMRLGYMEEFKIEEIRTVKKIKETYSEAEIKLLLKKPDIKKCTFVEFRSWTMINILLGTGMRVRTLINIRICDLDFENRLITYEHTKNRKQQIVPMSKTLEKVLSEYIVFRGGEPTEYLFPTQFGKQMSANSVQHVLKLYNRRRGVAKSGVHLWRHTFAKMWITNGGDMFKLQKMLGHSTLDVVKEYVEMFTEDLQKDFDNISPLEHMSDNGEHIKMRYRGI
ncbi:tyrosine-type recombinase/integrase [Clostridium sp. SHJSY1]|uniref:tyrosine-type recombinase/integrase n=1 Tax=Clostridium sp. SHJSY1 TaxID=2942483 RepID=UPI00287437B3|nr:tyrosine-type recombinase/integrase [Clostridium sp. SHJSY1]MDS0526182.1 tyrosine-type recombinase/integrase [Clostridium sp. SHJSY1]